MQNIPASAGWRWIQEGFALFRQQPAEFSALFIGYMFLMLMIGIVPVLGQLVPLVLVPTFTMAFMQACVQAQHKERVYPKLLLTGFRSPAFPNLLKLGGLYLLAAVLAVGLSSLMDGGVFWQAMSGQNELDPQAIQESDLTKAMLLALLLYLPAAMAFWHAAPLIMWQRMGVFKAIFYSFFAVRRAGKAFVLYGLGWLVLGVILPIVVSGFVSAIAGRSLATMLVLMPLSVVLTTIMYCSFYFTYLSAFGPPPGAPGARPAALPDGDAASNDGGHRATGQDGAEEAEDADHRPATPAEDRPEPPAQPEGNEQARHDRRPND